MRPCWYAQSGASRQGVESFGWLGQRLSQSDAECQRASYLVLFGASYPRRRSWDGRQVPLRSGAESLEALRRAWSIDAWTRLGLPISHTSGIRTEGRTPERRPRMSGTSPWVQRLIRPRGRHVPRQAGRSRSLVWRRHLLSLGQCEIFAEVRERSHHC